MTTYTVTTSSGYSTTEANSLYVCGGGERCMTFEQLTYTIHTNPTGQVRCTSCAERLGWDVPPTTNERHQP
jgi:hypothetical protein